MKRRIIDVLAPAEVHELYGASEGGATRISPDEWLAHPGSVGRPWPGVEVRILDDDGAPLPAGEQGLVYVTPMGSWKFHYHNDPDKTASAWRDDALTVGDIGYLDGDGYLYITDRASDMVLWGGVNIAPSEWRRRSTRTRPWSTARCSVCPTARDGEHLKAVVEGRPGVHVDELAAHVRTHLADYKVPREWELVDELPRDPSGKVLKRLLRGQAWAGRDSPHRMKAYRLTRSHTIVGSAELGITFSANSRTVSVSGKSAATARSRQPSACSHELLPDLLGRADEIAVAPRVERLAPEGLAAGVDDLLLGLADEHLGRPGLGDLVVVAPDRLAVALAAPRTCAGTRGACRRSSCSRHGGRRPEASAARRRRRSRSAGAASAAASGRTALRRAGRTCRRRWRRARVHIDFTISTVSRSMRMRSFAAGKP